MRFKLVEDHVKLEEEKLEEKYWVKLEVPAAPYIEPFYYYVINNTFKGNSSDLDALIDVVAGVNKGTFKQQLNRAIVDELKVAYKDCLRTKTPFTFNIVGHNIPHEELKSNQARLITLTDRDLRSDAHLDLGKGKTNSYDYLIHHKNEHEDDNDFSNLVLIPKNPALEYAHAIHKIIQKRGSALKSPKVIIPLEQWDGKSWVITNHVEIEII